MFMKERSMFVILSKEQYEKLPNKYKRYFVMNGGGNKNEHNAPRKNVHT